MIRPTTTSMKNPVRFRLVMFVLYVLPQLVVNGEQEMRCIPREREALLQFKGAIVDNYGMLSSWTTPDCCQWEGIRCSNLTSHILSLDLHGDYAEPFVRYMSGEIHKSLMELQQLEYLNLSSNDFRWSPFPEFFGSLKNLKYLDLSLSYFNGEIPSQFGSLSHLKYLNLALNSMKGSIPRELGNLSQLQYLNLSYNYFYGNIPSELGNLSQLQYLDLNRNILVGSIPSQLGNLSQLQYLGLYSYTSLEGSIPSQLGNLSRLQELYLARYNALNIDDGGQWLSNLISLTHLYLESVPNPNTSHSWLQVIWKLPKLRELSLIRCSLSDDFIQSYMPSKFNSSTSLSVLDLSVNSFKSPTVFQWVSNITSNLVELDLSRNLLEGSTSSHFVMLMNSLRHLDLSFNYFKAGDLKSFINICTLHSLNMVRNNLTEDLLSILGNLSNGCVRHSLQELDLTDNNITGTLSDISVFSSLKSLFLDRNRLSGRIPEGVKLPSTLEDLSMSSNSLQGGIPKSFRDACSLQSFTISDNSLSVELPMIISHLSGCARYSLQVLNLHGNQINGTLPDFSTFTSLKDLSLSENKLNGEIPKNIQFPPKLEDLDISSNSLKGMLTDYHFANMSKLNNLDLSDNSLSLAFTQNWVSPFQLVVIKLRSCKLGPTFPKWLQTQNKFVDIDISNATISSIIPEWFWAKLPQQKVIRMNISYNNLQGRIPNASSTYSRSMSLESNQFEGSIPLFLRNSEILDFSKNKFSNPLSFLCGNGTIQDLYYLDLSHNQLFGQIPDCWRQFNSLVYLDLSHNNFSGKIPTSIGSLLDLQALRLRNNNLVEEIPFSLRNCPELVMLDLSENKLSGSIPDWIGTKSKLQILSLGNNQFFGSLTLEVCCLKNIQVLDLSINNLSGKIPKCIKNLTSMAQPTSSIYGGDHSYLSKHSFFIISGGYDLNALLTWKGSEQMFMNKGLSLLKSIDLSSNRFSEEIPVEIEKLSGLISLNLSRNNLIGKIPSNIGKLASLDSLDLSRNRLVGSIPPSLAQIYGLGVLDLSHNHLSGEIPTSTQLQSFNKSSYEDNLDLCGPPLEKLCIGGEPTQKPNVNVYKDEYSIFSSEFFMSMGIGFALSFWTVFGSILFKRSWQQSYFNFLNNLKDNVYVKIAIFARVLKRDKE
ncbi:receptor-like protein EIX2 [Vigna umbellata]|uniref:receptor-like protein EIX2 n=1 Tax=Vigna umbellata TaxID=87088 RepID=UPI001F5EBF3A|nr:receptor-like protein EIX2 [Vigna umbellata]